jgi:hypothetical protein
MNSRVAASCALTSRWIFLASSIGVPVMRRDVLLPQDSTAARSWQPSRCRTGRSLQRAPLSLARGASPLALERDAARLSQEPASTLKRGVPHQTRERPLTAASGPCRWMQATWQQHHSSLVQALEQERLERAHMCPHWFLTMKTISISFYDDSSPG